MLLQTTTNDFYLINKSIANEYRHQMCKLKIQRGKEKFFDLLTNDTHLTSEERTKIFHWVQRNIEMIM